MRIERAGLVAALKVVSSGLAPAEEYNSFMFCDGRVFTYNDELAVSVPIEVDFEGAIPAKEFQSIVNKVKTKDISLTITNGELLLTGSKAKVGLRVNSDFVIPLEQVGMPKEWLELPDNFCDSVLFCLFSASNDDNKAILKNIHVSGQYVESCDNMRVTQCDMGVAAKRFFPEDLLIPAKAAKDIICHVPVEYGLTDGWLHFRTIDGITFSCRHFNSEYPDFSAFLECKGEDFEFPATITEVMDRAGVMGDGERVTIILENDELIVATENVNGWFEESIDVDYKATPMEFDIQPEFFKSIMKFNATATIGQRALRFEGDDFIHVCLILPPKSKK